MEPAEHLATGERCSSAQLWDVLVDRLPVERVPIASIRAADSPRLAGESAEHARLLAQSDEILPPIIVHRRTMRVIDGMHRLKAAELRNQHEIDVRFFDGDEDEVFVLAVRANTRHGLPLTHADRTAAATRIVRSHPQWSDRMIAGTTGLSPKTVGGIRRRLTEELPQMNLRLGHDGRMRPVDSAEGRRLAAKFIVENPEATLRQIAKAVGVSLATARDVRNRVRRGESPMLPKRGERADGPVAAEPREEAAVERPAGDRSPGMARIMPILKRDPSIRYTDQGRLLLRLLDANTMLGPDQWNSLIENVPPHCRELVANAARECAEVWRQVAQQMRNRAG
ncbi:streptomycin biosynthesis protein [Sphaerisporangium album]|uniref:Streptomycin biosynthesis protein n=2 Tax=Sphaerisporangium album TaxID=509200 RepID=A0A367F2P0_9ACTN|nr:streptomycin biosynthesis protein [Sphaerisporangium album]